MLELILGIMLLIVIFSFGACMNWFQKRIAAVNRRNLELSEENFHLYFENVSLKEKVPNLAELEIKVAVLLKDSEQPMKPYLIWEKLENKNLPFKTMYKALTSLVECGMVKKGETGEYSLDR